MQQYNWLLYLPPPTAKVLYLFFSVCRSVYFCKSQKYAFITFGLSNFIFACLSVCLSSGVSVRLSFSRHYENITGKPMNGISCNFQDRSDIMWMIKLFGAWDNLETSRLYVSILLRINQNQYLDIFVHDKMCEDVFLQKSCFFIHVSMYQNWSYARWPPRIRMIKLWKGICVCLW